MRHEKILKREDGTQYQISVNLHLDSFSKDVMNYRIDVRFKEKGKRIWKEIPKSEVNWRSLSMEDRRKSDDLNVLRFVSEVELYDAKLEAWMLLKPKNL